MTHSVTKSVRHGRRLKVGFILADRFTLSAFANFIDVLRLAADESDRSRPILCDWSVLSEDMNQIRSSSGIKVQPDQRLNGAGEFDYIAVVGGLIQGARPFSLGISEFLRERAAKGTPLIGLCTGVFFLHDTGLLSGYKCCVSWFHHDDFILRFDGTQPVSDQIYVVDRDRLTCSGGQSTAHLAAHIVERHLGQSAATKSLSILIVDKAMSGERPQPGIPSRFNATHVSVRKALARMQQTLDMPQTVKELAEWLDVGQRSLERRFKDEFNLTPSRVWLEIRLDHARDLLMRSDRSITQIALESGFCDAPHFIRVFRKEFGQTPARFRE